MQVRTDNKTLRSGLCRGWRLKHARCAAILTQRACGIGKRIARALDFFSAANSPAYIRFSLFTSRYRNDIPLCVLALFAITNGTQAIAGHVARTASATDRQAPISTALQRRVAKNVQSLASDKWRNRRRAERNLLSIKGFVLPQLAAAMVKAKNPEQRDRLLRVCLQLYLRQFNWLHHGSAFIGVEFVAQALELRRRGIPHWIPAVAVVRTVAGFPGGLYLHENDLVLGINGHPIPAYNTANAFREEIQRHEPGGVITLLVLRNGKLIHVPVQLTGIAADPLAAQELLSQRNVIALHLISKYLPVRPLVLAPSSR